ncbi:MAG TPA: carboxymuconolactone decarboxylase family protein [Beijerinckiaceae bacterium]|nr:carboxymuconolactone decarboxylase family protein [Beijerinckiaceae bacterium]
MDEARKPLPFENVKVSRLPPLSEPLDPITLGLFEDTLARGGHILNLHIMNGHAPKLARARRPYTKALRSECSAPRQLREIAIVRASQLVGCDYELKQHSKMVLAAGLTQAQLDALGDWRANAQLFDERQRALLAYLDCLGLKKGDVDDATFAGMEKFFLPQEIIELTQCFTSYYGSGIFMRAMQLKLDAPNKSAAPGTF